MCWPSVGPWAKMGMTPAQGSLTQEIGYRKGGNPSTADAAKGIASFANTAGTEIAPWP